MLDFGHVIVNDHRTTTLHITNKSLFNMDIYIHRYISTDISIYDNQQYIRLLSFYLSDYRVVYPTTNYHTLFDS